MADHTAGTEKDLWLAHSPSVLSDIAAIRLMLNHRAQP
jgi:hypothetical protein